MIVVLLFLTKLCRCEGSEHCVLDGSFSLVWAARDLPASSLSNAGSDSQTAV